jgi:manganese oxidase
MASGAVYGVVVPLSNGSAISQCASQMDGSLPYYTPEGFNFSGNIRRYYVSAEITPWNYAPTGRLFGSALRDIELICFVTGWDNWLGVPLDDSFRAQTWGYLASNTNIGTIYDKALYRGYTGPDFQTLTEQPPWQGYMGPTMRAEVGDMIEVCILSNQIRFS